MSIAAGGAKAMRMHRGFTLIELTITIAIISVLAAVALPAYQDYLTRAQVSEGLAIATGARAAVWEYTANYGSLPLNNLSAGLPEKESITGEYVTEVAIGANGIRVTFGMHANKAISGSTLLLAPALSTGSLDWECTGGTLEPRHRPSICR